MNDPQKASNNGNGLTGLHIEAVLLSCLRNKTLKDVPVLVSDRGLNVG